MIHYFSRTGRRGPGTIWRVHYFLDLIDMWGCQEGHFPFCRLEVRVTYSLTCRSLGIFLRANGSHLLRTPSSGKWHIVLYVPFSKIADSHLPNQRPWGNSEETLVGQRYSMLSLAYEEPYAQRGRSGDSFSSIFCYLPKEAPPAKSNDGVLVGMPMGTIIWGRIFQTHFQDNRLIGSFQKNIGCTFTSPQNFRGQIQRIPT